MSDALTTLEEDIVNLNAKFDNLRDSLVAVLQRLAREKATHTFQIPYMPMPMTAPVLPRWEYTPPYPNITCGVKANTTNPLPQADGCSDPGDVHGA